MTDTHFFNPILTRLVADIPTTRLYFAGQAAKPPILSFVVNFPRLSIPLVGCHEMLIEQKGRSSLISPTPGQAILVPPNCWNKPTWQKPVEVLTVLFGRRQTGFSLVTADGTGPDNITAQKFSIPRPITGPAKKLLDMILQLHETSPQFTAFPQLTDALLASLTLFTDQSAAPSKSRAQQLFQNICSFLQENFQYDITRESTAAEFAITPNHLSRLFRSEGSMNFSDYLTYVRIDRAKFMLASYDMTLKELAPRCGFRDSAYFCRVFKKFTRRTPAQYRHHLHSSA